MNKELYKQSHEIINASITAVQPESAVIRALSDSAWLKHAKRIFIIAIGKAAWKMAKTATQCIDDKIFAGGVAITKYGHSFGDLPKIIVYEAGHPIPDINSFSATEEAIKMIKGLSENDYVLFLVSGGGSALFEKPLIPHKELESITEQLLASGADIVEMNTIRKRLSAVKGGRFAQLCAPAKIFSIVLSDIIGDPLDMIASGPAYPDSSTCQQAFEIINKYGINLGLEAKKCLATETPKKLDNVATKVSGSVSELCIAAANKCKELGYAPQILTDSLNCIARDAGIFLASIARFHKNTHKSMAFLAGGETVVKLTGAGKGGRSQEIALAAAAGIAGIKNIAIFSFGSDGTDGPTDAAGGYVDGSTLAKLREKNIDVHTVLKNNDAYHALDAINGLIKTGPTGTNVNDLAVVLIQGK